MKVPVRIFLGGVIGGLVGGFLGIWGVLWIAGLLYGPRLEQGALIVFYTGPIGALLGFVVGAVVAWISARLQ